MIPPHPYCKALRETQTYMVTLSVNQLYPVSLIDHRSLSVSLNCTQSSLNDHQILSVLSVSLNCTHTPHLRVTQSEVLCLVIPFWRMTSTEIIIIVCFCPGELEYNPSITGLFLVLIQYLKLTRQMLIFSLLCSVCLYESQIFTYTLSVSKYTFNILIIISDTQITGGGVWEIPPVSKPNFRIFNMTFKHKFYINMIKFLFCFLFNGLFWSRKKSNLSADIVHMGGGPSPWLYGHQRCTFFLPSYTPGNAY